MIITVKLITQRSGPVNGIVQIGTQAQQTVDGMATFSIEENGEYTVRGACHVLSL